MIRTSLDAVVVLSAAALLLIAAIGGIDLDLGPLRLRLHEWTRPLALLIIAVALRAWACRADLSAVAPRGAKVEAAGVKFVSYAATTGMLALLIATAGVYTRYHIRVAGGLDSYGYLSASSLLASGRFSEPQPLAALLPFEDAMSAAAPLGYVPSADGERSVPRFPLGLPIVMAIFSIFGLTGPFYVPLVMAYASIGLAYLLGREPTSGIVPHHEAGLLASMLIAVDPLFAAYAIQPMSDVPATCWLLAAIWSLKRRWEVGGVCAGMAILTRPALLPAVIVLIVMLAKEKCTRPLLVVAAFVAGQLALNTALYGGMTASGYGSTSHMFELSLTRLAANVSNFEKWLTYSHTPLFWLLWPGALFVLRHDRWAWQMSAVAATAAAPYFFYIVFDDWESSRFLLPSIALIAIMSVRALSHLTHLSRLTHLAMLGIALASAAASHGFLEREGIYRLPTLEAKYALVGEWFKRNTSDRVVVLAGLHSGSIRLYGDRATIRWDQVPEPSLTATLRSLIAAGYEPYLVLDAPTEPPLFEKRFMTQSMNAEQVARVRVVNIYKFVSVY